MARPESPAPAPTQNRLQASERQDFSHLSPLELIRSGERTERAETLQLSTVITDYSLVDENHAQELGESMSLDRGQISPIVVRPRMNEGNEVVYDVIDGFHRTEGQRKRGADSIKAIVVYGCSDEEMYDLRILAASSVKSVQFPRIAEWITRSYEQTKWKGKGVSVLQAFSIANNDRDSSYRIKNKEDLSELKAWIKDKCKSWQKSLGYVLNVLKIVDVADPALVKQVRVSGGGKDREAKVTPQRIEKIALSFPRNFPVQNEVMAASISNRMSADETSLLVEIVRPKIEDIKDVRKLRMLVEEGVTEVNRRSAQRRKQEREIEAEFVSNVSDDEYTPDETLFETTDDKTALATGSKNGSSAITPSVPRLTSKQMDDLADQIAREALAKEASGESIDDEDLHSGFADSGEYVRPSYSVFDGGTARIYEPTGVNVDGQMDFEELKQDRDRLRSILESRDSKTVGWWVTATYVSSEEKAILTDLFTEGKSFENVCKDRKLLQKQVESLIRSALLRRQIFLTKQEVPASSV